MDFTKVLEIFSHNWLVIISLILILPIIKTTIVGWFELQKMKISNKDKIELHLETLDGVKKSLSITTNSIKDNSIKDELLFLENKIRDAS